MDLWTQIAEFAANQLCDSVTVWLKPLKDQLPNSVALIYYSIMIYDIVVQVTDSLTDLLSAYRLKKLKTNFAKW